MMNPYYCGAATECRHVEQAECNRSCFGVCERMLQAGSEEASSCCHRNVSLEKNVSKHALCAIGRRRVETERRARAWREPSAGKGR